MKNKYILTDVDGVLLDWLATFDLWMRLNGFAYANNKAYRVKERFNIPEDSEDLVRKFNESELISNLGSFRDAKFFVGELNKLGYRFIVITSQTNDYDSQIRRIGNLKQVFGDVFEEFHILDTGADKDGILTRLRDQYEGCYWIEDKPENADAGANLGYDSILIKHDHNNDYDGPARVVRRWSEIYEIIVGKPHSVFSALKNSMCD